MLPSALTPPSESTVAKTLRRHRGPLLAAGSVLAVALAMAGLANRASDEARLRKTDLALAYEADPQAWLTRPTLPGALMQAFEAGRLESVALASAPSGTTAGAGASTLALYTTTDGARYATRLPACAPTACAGGVLDTLTRGAEANGVRLVAVDIDVRTPAQAAMDAVTTGGGSVATFALLLGGLGWAARRQQRENGGAVGCLTERPDLSFDDVVGAEEAKAGLQRVQAFLRDPRRYAELGAKAPRGVLLQGPPGTGKTLLAKALAGECGAHFIAVDGSYFTSMFFGTGVAKVRQLFATARKHAPCVLFIDEIDGLGKRSTGEMRGGESELNRIINRVLIEMDGFGAADSVVVIGATNHADNLDPALVRPGRFDQIVQVALPTVHERRALFDLYAGKVRTDGALDTAALGRMTSGMSPADIASTVNAAASTAAEQGAAGVTQEHLLRAVETRQLGGEVASATMKVIGEQTRKRIARHEAGHALVGHLLGAGLVERVTIEARGPALGVTYMTREREEPLYAQAELTARLAMMLGGREAELTTFGDVSSGASDDLKRASELAVQMVSTLGFSNTFGLLSVAGVPKELIGPDTQASALREARALLDTAQQTCRTLLTRHVRRLDALTDALLEHDHLSGRTLRDLLDGRGVTRLCPQTGEEIDRVPSTFGALALASAAAVTELAG